MKIKSKTNLKIADFIVYPKFRCSNCKGLFRLNHDPKKDRKGMLLPNIVCPHCQDYAHFSNYYPVSFMIEYYTATDYTFLRDLMKIGKFKLSNL